MPKSKGTKYYAVLIGRNGPQIYNTWEECKDKVSRYPGAVHKSFKGLQEAQQWLATHPRAGTRPRPVPSEVIDIDSDTENEVKRPARPEVIVVDSDDDDEPIIIDPATTRPAATAAAATPEKPAVILSPEQKAVLDRVRAGENVFFTGSAGTGKSVLLREIITHCRDRGGDIAITATTGIAAVNIGGCTLHSWAGIGLGKDSATKFIGKFRGNAKLDFVLQRWRRTTALIIDEISMLDGNLFDKLEAIGRGLRNSSAPFGGIQLILCGDFCQLPPVSGRDEQGREMPATFAFESLSWDSCVGRPMMLTKVFRQKDQRFVDMLNEMRYGVLSPGTIDAFRRLSRNVEYKDGIVPTEIYALRDEVSTANAWRLAQLKTEEKTFRAFDQAGYDSEGRPISEERKRQLLSKLVCQAEVTLKVGAQVMLIKNLIQGELVNGSVGQVTRFENLAVLGKEEKEGKPIDGLYLPDGTTAKCRTLPADQAYPVVKFIGGRERVITPADFEITSPDNKMEARRIQIPLILAWALSVHKSQGQTLERVKVDLGRTFEKGQAYVAISRATCLEQLQIVNFDPGKVMAHPRVLAWYGAANKSAERDYFDDFDEMDSEFIMQSFHEY